MVDNKYAKKYSVNHKKSNNSKFQKEKSSDNSKKCDQKQKIDRNKSNDDTVNCCLSKKKSKDAKVITKVASSDGDEEQIKFTKLDNRSIENEIAGTLDEFSAFNEENDVHCDCKLEASEIAVEDVERKEKTLRKHT